MVKDLCNRSWNHRSCRIVSVALRHSRILLILPCLGSVEDSFRTLRDVQRSLQTILKASILQDYFSHHETLKDPLNIAMSWRCWRFVQDPSGCSGFRPQDFHDPCRILWDSPELFFLFFFSVLFRPAGSFFEVLSSSCSRNQSASPPSRLPPPLPPRSASLPALCIFLNSFFPSASTLMLIDEDVAVKDWSFYLRISLGRCRHRRYSSASIDIHWHSLTSARMILIIVSPITILIQIMDNGSPFSLVVATTHSSDYQRFRLPASAMINLLLTSLMIVESFLAVIHWWSFRLIDLNQWKNPTWWMSFNSFRIPELLICCYPRRASINVEWFGPSLIRFQSSQSIKMMRLNAFELIPDSGIINLLPSTLCSSKRSTI